MSAGDANVEALLTGMLSKHSAARKRRIYITPGSSKLRPAGVVGQTLRCLASGRENLAADLSQLIGLAMKRLDMYASKHASTNYAHFSAFRDT